MKNVAGRIVLLFLLAAAPMTACKEPGYRAERLTREGVAALHAGITEQEIVSAVGPPVSRIENQSGALMAYAKPSHRKLGPRRFGEKGMTFVVFVTHGHLKTAHIYDPPYVCSCDARACESDWAKLCLGLFRPTGGVSAPGAAGVRR